MKKDIIIISISQKRSGLTNVKTDLARFSETSQCKIKTFIFTPPTHFSFPTKKQTKTQEYLNKYYIYT